MKRNRSSQKSSKIKILRLDETDKTEEIGEDDRISRFPDNILQHILSCMPTHYAVHTCVLSRRWRYIWTGIPKLKFIEMDDFYETINFRKFVENVVRLHNPTAIDKFHLELEWNFDGCLTFEEPRLKTLITKVLRRKVQKLNLVIPAESYIVFPRSLYVCESLTVLKLDARYTTLKMPASVCFPNLKVMNFRCIEFSCQKGIEQVSFTCPVLEEIILTECEWSVFKAIDIFAPALIRMIIDDAEADHTFYLDCEIKFYAESLLTLDVRSSLPYGLYFCNVSSLYDANIDIGGAINNSQRVSKLMQGISMVKELILSYHTIRKLTSMKELLAFSNLFNLIVSRSKSFDGKLLTELFSSLPDIRSLHFMRGLNKNSHEGYDWPIRVPQSFLLHLKLFDITNFYGNETELSLVEFLLMNASALVTILIRSSKELSTDLKKQMEITKRLLIIPRASMRCVIDFS